MKPKYLWPLSIVLWLCVGAATVNSIKFFTDYPNSSPIDSDFFVLQRNQSYINSSAAQTRQFFFNQPSFTGGGFISGQWHVGGDSWVEGIYYGNGIGLSNILGTATNTIINIITNNTFVNTNILISTSTNYENVTIITNLYSTNITVDNITNVNFFSTNVTVENITNNTFVNTNVAIINNITNNTFFTTNVTINQPGGFTNLNLVPLSVMYVDVNDAESTVPNAVGVLTNNGSGGVGFSLSLSLDELDILNGYITNFFTGLTNYGVLGTDANGLLTVGSSTITNISITNAFIQNLTNNTFVNTNVFISTSNAYFNSFYATNAYITTNFSTNLYFVSGKGNTLIITNVSVDGTLTNKGIAASSAVITTSAQVETNAPNAHGVFTNTASGPPSFGLLQNAEMANSSITISGTGNQVGVSGGGPVSLGGTATLSIPSVFIAPGTLAAVTSMTNQSFNAVGVVTNDDKGKLFTTPTLPKTLVGSVYGTNLDMTPILWGGPSNTIVINNGYQQYATSTPTSITNQTTTSVWSTLVISNQLSTSITQFCTIPNIRYIGPNSTNALTVGAGKVGVWSFLTFSGQLTNCVNLSQQ